MTTKHRVLIISNDVIGRKMAGPGIRYYHIARTLSPFCELQLTFPDDNVDREFISEKLPGVSVSTFEYHNWASIVAAAQWAEVILMAGDLSWVFPQLADLPAKLVIDGYDPQMAEWLEMSSSPGFQMEHRHRIWREHFTKHHAQHNVGDFFICASERQRDWWLGRLEAGGRINPDTHTADHSFRNLIDVVPYGVPNFPPPESQQVVKGVWEGIGTDDTLILWGGGLWSWLDPMTAIRAVAHLTETHPNIRLIFPGTLHPNPRMDGTPTWNKECFALARELGVFDKNVFFGDWLPYEQWPALLVECDVALSLHFETLETHLAFRSRMLEYIWASLPVVANDGDATGDLVTKYGLGRLVESQNVDAVAQAIADLIDENPVTREDGFAKARHDLSWERAVEPLIRFVCNPQRAADRPDSYATGSPRFRTDGTLPWERIIELENLVAAYESGKFMRLMRWLKDVRRKVGL